jgi:hypothetical protein
MRDAIETRGGLANVGVAGEPNERARATRGAAAGDDASSPEAWGAREGRRRGACAGRCARPLPNRGIGIAGKNRRADAIGGV